MADAGPASGTISSLSRQKGNGAVYRIKRPKDSEPEVHFECPECGVSYVTSLAHAGRTEPCMICGTASVVPGEKELAEYRREQAALPPGPEPEPEPATLLDRMGKKFIREVRDEALDGQVRRFFPQSAQRGDDGIFNGLVSKLDESQKDLLWKMLTDAVEHTIDHTIRFVDHKRVTGEMLVTLLDAATHEEAVLTGRDQDVPTSFWFDWLEKYPRVKGRPTTHRQPIRQDWGETAPQPVLDAAARHFPGAKIEPLYRELTSGVDAPTAYLLRIGDDDDPVAYSPDGFRR